MNEQFKGETNQITPEQNEEQLYDQLMKIINEQNRIIKEMGTGEVENIKELMAQMDNLMKEETKAWEAYKRAIEEAHEQEKV